MPQKNVGCRCLGGGGVNTVPPCYVDVGNVLGS